MASVEKTLTKLTAKWQKKHGGEMPLMAVNGDGIERRTPFDDLDEKEQEVRLEDVERGNREAAERACPSAKTEAVRRPAPAEPERSAAGHFAERERRRERSCASRRPPSGRSRAARTPRRPASFPTG